VVDGEKKTEQPECEVVVVVFGLSGRTSKRNQQITHLGPCLGERPKRPSNVDSDNSHPTVEFETRFNGEESVQRQLGDL